MADYAALGMETPEQRRKRLIEERVAFRLKTGDGQADEELAQEDTPWPLAPDKETEREKLLRTAMNLPPEEDTPEARMAAEAADKQIVSESLNPKDEPIPEVAQAPAAPTPELPWSTSNLNAQELTELRGRGTSEGYEYTDPATGKKIYKAWRKTSPAAQAYRGEVDAGTPTPGRMTLRGKTPGTYASDPTPYMEFKDEPPPFSERPAQGMAPLAPMDEATQTEAAYDYLENLPASPRARAADPTKGGMASFTQTGNPQLDMREDMSLAAFNDWASSNRESISNMSLPQYLDAVRNLKDSQGRPVNTEDVAPYLANLAKKHMPAKAKREYDQEKLDREETAKVMKSVRMQKKQSDLYKKAGLMSEDDRAMQKEEAKQKSDTEEKQKAQKLAIGTAKNNVRDAERYRDRIKKKLEKRPVDETLMDALAEAEDTLLSRQDALNLLTESVAGESPSGGMSKGEVPAATTGGMSLDEFVADYTREHQGKAPTQTHIDTAKKIGLWK